MTIDEHISGTQILLLAMVYNNRYNRYTIVINVGGRGKRSSQIARASIDLELESNQSSLFASDLNFLRTGMHTQLDFSNLE